MCPPRPVCWSPNPTVTVFGDGPLGPWLRLNEVVRVGPGPYKKRGLAPRLWILPEHWPWAPWPPEDQCLLFRAPGLRSFIQAALGTEGGVLLKNNLVRVYMDSGVQKARLSSLPRPHTVSHGGDAVSAGGPGPAPRSQAPGVTLFLTHQRHMFTAICPMRAPTKESHVPELKTGRGQACAGGTSGSGHLGAVGGRVAVGPGHITPELRRARAAPAWPQFPTNRFHPAPTSYASSRQPGFPPL